MLTFTSILLRFVTLSHVKSLAGFVKYAVAYEIADAMKYAAAYAGIYFISHFADKAKYFIIRRIISYCVAIFH